MEKEDSNLYIKRNDSRFKNNFLELEKHFNELSLNRRKSIKINNLCEEITSSKISIEKCIQSNSMSQIISDFYTEDSNHFLIGPLSSLYYLLELTYLHDDNIEKMLEEKNELNKKLSYWRPVYGEGNCYYRAVMFALIEKMILYQEVFAFKEMICEIIEMINMFESSNLEDKFPMLFLSKGVKFDKEKYCDFLNLLLMLQELVENDKRLAYEAFIKIYYMMENEKKYMYFDLGLIIYHR